MTPEQATPREYPVRMRDDCSFDMEWFFTAAETAQIAKAYLAAYLAEKRARLRPDAEHKRAEAKLREWRKRLAEWQK